MALSRVSSADSLYLSSKIKETYLLADQKVLDFYNKDSFVTKEQIPAKTGRKRKFSGLDTKTVRLPAKYIDFVTKLCDKLASAGTEEKELEELLKSIKN